MTRLDTGYAPPSVPLSAIAAEARTARAMRSGQWAHDTSEPDDDDDAAEEVITVRPTPKPLLDAAAVIAECEKDAEAYAKRIGADSSAMWAYRCGLLQAMVRTAAAQLEEVRRELQTAVDETCNSYHSAGHAERVQRLYGITEAVAA